MPQSAPSSLVARLARRAIQPLLVALACFAVAAPAPAQPGIENDGWFVVGTFAYTAGGWPFPGPSGMFLVHPRNPVNAIEVTGLPPNLTGSYAGGIWSMTRRASDGALFVAEVNTAIAGPANIHEIQLVGSTAVIVQTHVVGTSDDVTSCAALPDGTVLIGASGMIGGPMAFQQLGILDPATGVVTALPASMTGGVEAVAVDRTGTLAYVVVSQGVSGPGALYEVPLPAGQPATQVATFTNRPRTVVVDNDGRVAVGTHWNGGGVFVWDPATPQTPPTMVPGLPTGGVFAITIERATGNYVVGQAIAGNSGVQAAWLPSTGGGLTGLTTGPAGGWGTIRALVALDNPRVLDPALPGTPGYSWAVAPNPGGLPTLGNAAFSLTWTADAVPAPLVSFIGLSTSPATVSLPGLPPVLAQPDAIALVATSTVALPIPASPALEQVPFFAQMLHLTATTVASSEVLRLTPQ